MEEIKCIFCENKSNNRVLIEENGYQGKKCDRCGLIYVSPRPSADEIYDLYGHDDAQISATSHISSDYLKRLYARQNLSIITSYINKGKILEIGAGAGYFLDEARKIGLEPYGLEFNPIQADFIRNNLKIPCEEASIGDSVFAGEKFDIVYHCDVISHFFDPIAEFKTMNRIMKDDSYLVFETGNFGDVDPKYFKHIKRFQYPDHLFFFSNDNLISLLEETGFELVKIHRYSILPQLRMNKVFTNLIKLGKKQAIQNNKEKQNTSQENNILNISNLNSAPVKKKSSLKKTLSNTYKYVNYLFRYKIGAIAPKTNRPQTIVVVAKKKS